MTAETELPPAPKDRSVLLTQCGQILDEARKVLVERGANYADIADNSRAFHQIMLAMGVQIPADMTPTMFHCLSNIATKMARMATGNKRHEDTMIDAANYWTLMLADLRREGQEAKP